MFLMRAAFWLSLVVLLLPTDASQQERFTETAGAAVRKVSTFCDHNVRLCDTGSKYWAIFKEKAAYGAKLATDLVSEYHFAEDRQVRKDAGSRRSQGPAQTWRGTLRPDDLVPPWRGNGA